MVGTLTGVVVTTRRRSLRTSRSASISATVWPRPASAASLSSVPSSSSRSRSTRPVPVSEVDKLKEELKKVTKKDVQINIYEVKRPEVDANIVADSIARQIEGRVSYRRAIKMAIANTMRVGAEGIKVQIAGRVGGAEMARSEMFKEGRTPLHTFRADIDYALAVANTKVGTLGIKVWICNGERYGKQDLTPAALAAANAQATGQNRGGGRGGDRRPRRDGDRDRRPRRDNK